MRLICIRQFGNFLPGDEYPVEIPEDAVFDHTYFAAKPSETADQPPVATSRRQKEDER